MPSSPLRLSHPNAFETRTLPVKKTQNSQQKLSHRIDNKVLEAQALVAKKVARDEISLGHFCEIARDLEQIQTMHARSREDGFNVKERAELKKAFQQIGKGKSRRIDLHLKALFQQVRGGSLKADDLTEELNWRSQKSYGAVALERQGPIYQEERHKLRAALHIPRKERPATLKKSYHHPKLGQLAQKALGLFSSLDQDGNEIVDRKEARSLLTDYDKLNLTPAEATTLYSRQKQLAALVDPKTSGEKLERKDLELLLPENYPAKPDDELKETVTEISVRFRHQLRSSTPDPKNFLLSDHFQPNNVKQGKEGSCWMLCNLPALNQQELGNLIAPEGPNYRVTLKDGRTTLVAPLNEAERRTYSHGDGAWSGLVEKGVSQILEAEEQDLNGGFARIGREMLSGEKSVQLSFDRKSGKGPDLRDREVLFDTMEQAFSEGSAVFAAAHKEDHEKGISEISASTHAYTVLDIDRDNDAVIVRNPWGRSENADLDGANNGVFELTQDQFFANFSYIYVDEKVA